MGWGLVVWPGGGVSVQGVKYRYEMGDWAGGGFVWMHALM